MTRYAEKDAAITGIGMAAVSCAAPQDALRLELGWYAGGGEAPVRIAAVGSCIEYRNS